jgi:tetratricopeptide (TPR) repeat protein
MKTCQGGACDDRRLSAITAVALLSAALAAACGPGPAIAADACASPAGRVTSVQGHVELHRAASSGWQAAKQDDTVCPGDMVRVGEHSRAALMLRNETTLRLDQNTALTFPVPDPGPTSLLKVLTGAVNFISRTQRPFRVETPYVNASIEGTEFLVGVAADSARIAVFEGRVVADNERGSVSLLAGEQAIASKDSAPRKDVVVRPSDAVQWALYFPTLFDYTVRGTAAQGAGATTLRESIELYRSGQVAEAIARLQGLPESAISPQLLSLRAGLLLQVGRLDEARPDLERALALAPSNGDATALGAVIAVVTNDKPEALKRANRAVELDPKSPAAWLALSYAQQAGFQIDEATASVRRAAGLDPGNALIWARLAELEMSAADRDRALQDAKKAQDLNPGLAKTQVVRGFANLVRIDLPGAKAAFTRAIELDPADPLARLGLGLARIREGELQAGREEIEIAVSLDPGNSLLRSYVGKAYYEERRDKLAATQLGLAKGLDPLDPTPWLYDAIRKQTENRPVEALQDLEKSIELNDNRAVYRSEFLLDQDQAARRVNQARIYRDLGFDQLALVEAYKSLSIDPGSDSAHRFLADAYADVERGDITRVSESLQAQLRQPVSTPSVDLLLGTDNLFILRDNGPFRLGTNEFNQLFDRDQIRLQADGIAGTHQTFGDQVAISGLADKIGYSLSQLHFETDGFGNGNSAQKEIYDAFAQVQLTLDSTAQLDLKRTQFQANTVWYPFDPIAFPLRFSQGVTSVRLGGMTNFDDSNNVIWSVIHGTERTSLLAVPDVFGGPFSQDTAQTYSAEFQYLRRFAQFHLIAGAGYAKKDDQFDIGYTVGSIGTDAYAYGSWNSPGGRLAAELGVAAELVNIGFSATGLSVKRDRVSPKLGLTFSPFAGTTIRLAAFSSVKRPFPGSQTIEPTQVAGFNQFFAGFDQFYGDLEGTQSERACFAIDQKLDMKAYIGAELTVRKLRVPFQNTDYDWREKTVRLYAYQAFGPFSRSSALSKWQLAASFEYLTEKLDRPQEFDGQEGVISLKTDRIPLSLRAFDDRGLTVGAQVSYVRQSGLFSVGDGFEVFPKHETAIVTDLFVDFRMPRRRGTISIGAKNLFDRSIGLFETDPAFPTIPARRFVYAKLNFHF